MNDDPRCCGSGTCIIDAEGRCWCGQQWDGHQMVAPPLTPCAATPPEGTAGQAAAPPAAAAPSSATAPARPGFGAREALLVTGGLVSGAFVADLLDGSDGLLP